MKKSCRPARTLRRTSVTNKVGVTCYTNIGFFFTSCGGSFLPAALNQSSAVLFSESHTYTDLVLLMFVFSTFIILSLFLLHRFGNAGFPESSSSNQYYSFSIIYLSIIKCPEHPVMDSPCLDCPYVDIRYMVSQE